MKGNRLVSPKSVFLMLILSLTALSACREVDNVVYSEFIPVDPDGWDPIESFEFSPFPADSVSAFDYSYDVRIMVRYDRSASNRKLPLVVEQINDDIVVRQDSVTLTLFDNDGNPVGKGSLGVFERNALITQGMRLKKGYKVNVVSLLNKADTKGILNAGVSLTRVMP